MKEKVFVFEAERQNLTAGLSDAAAQVTALGDVVRAHFPRIPWGVPFLWVMLQDPTFDPYKDGFSDYKFRRYLSDTILNNAAKENGLDCGPGWSNKTTRYVESKVAMLASTHPLANLSDDARLNRKFVEMQHRAATRQIDGFKINPAYLRTGALSIGENGETITAPGAAERLAEFCTLYAETKAQRDFLAKLAQYRAAVLSLPAICNELARLATTGLGRNELKKEASKRGASWQLDLGGIDATDKDAAARALISFFGLSGKTDTAPKFYNRANVPAYGLADLYTITGGLIGEKDAPKAEEKPARRSRYGEYFKAYPRIITD